MKQIKKLLLLMMVMVFGLSLLTACGSSVGFETDTSEYSESAGEGLSVDESVSQEKMVSEDAEVDQHYYFRNSNLLNQHFKKHGEDMGYSSPEEYEEAACQVINNPDALHKTEKEDGDDVYYLEETNEFVILSSDGYIRTYFLPDAGIKYYNKQ